MYDNDRLPRHLTTVGYVAPSRIFRKAPYKLLRVLYCLDPVHYYTTPGFAWDAAHRMSRVDLQRITDVDMYHFVENSIRGGISMISIRHAQANSPSFLDTYDASLSN